MPRFGKGTRADTEPATSGEGTRCSLQELIALRQEAARLALLPQGPILATRSGGHLSRFRGRGMEYSESRIYQPGDDPRTMDWRVTARVELAHVKVFREERERPLWLLVDQCASMRFGSRVAFKSVLALKAAALLAWSAAEYGDRVGGVVFDERGYDEHRPTARGRGVLRLLHTLSGFGGRAATVASEPCSISSAGLGGSALARAADRLATRLRPGSLVFVISDFAGIGDADAVWLGRLAAASELVLLHLYDALEQTAPPPGLYPVSHAGRRFLLDTGRVGLAAAWSGSFVARRVMLQGLSRRFRAHLLGLRTDQPLGETLRLGLHAPISTGDSG